MDSRLDTPSNGSSTSVVLAGDRLALRSGAKLPVPVMLLWACALAGLAVYTASWYVPSLAQLGR
jgi:hypothetical protein